jgi:ubiquinone/menaquinone biosynthesis C-methylase UbiE
MADNLHFDQYGRTYDQIKAKYYYSLVKKEYSSIIPAGKTILDIGCGTGEMLNALKPSKGVGIDISPSMIEEAKAKYKEYSFIVAEGEKFNQNIGGKYDFIVMVDLIEHLVSVDETLAQVYGVCGENTKIVASWYNPLWEPAVWLAEKFKIKMPEGPHKLVSMKRFSKILIQQGFAIEKFYYRFPLPVYLPGISDLLNEHIIKVSFIAPLLFYQFVIFHRRLNK